MASTFDLTPLSATPLSATNDAPASTRVRRSFDPQLYAKVGGICYVIVIILGAFQEVFIRGRITVGSAAQTFANLQKMEMLWRAGIVTEMLMMIVGIVLAVILYALTKPVHADLALLGFLFGVIATTVECAYSIQLVEALFPIGRGAYLTAFTPAQLHAMTTLAMKTHIFGFGIALFLFGPFFFVTGYLIFKSGYLPKTIGVLYQLAGAGYMANGFTLILAPRFANQALMAVALPVLAGEVSFALWLLIKGVRMKEWREVNGERGLS
jgi:hypothetical protein